MSEVEDYFLPYLGKDSIEGKLEVRCPNCGKDIAIYDRLSQIPDQLECEVCGFKFSNSMEYIEIVLEVKDKFFRNRKHTCSTNKCYSDK